MDSYVIFKKEVLDVEIIRQAAEEYERNIHKGYHYYHY